MKSTVKSLPNQKEYWEHRIIVAERCFLTKDLHPISVSPHVSLYEISIISPKPAWKLQSEIFITCEKLSKDICIPHNMMFLDTVTRPDQCVATGILV